MTKKKIQLIGWCSLGILAIVLLVTSIKTKDTKTCTGINIEVKKTGNIAVVNEKEIEEELNNNGAIIGKEIGSIPLSEQEKSLKKNVWIKDVDMFFDNKAVLKVKVQERQPLARVFTLQGNSFYVDDEGMRLPVNRFFVPVPVFTSFPSDKQNLSLEDSLVLQDAIKIAKIINKDSFLTALVSQVDILPKRNYTIVPVIGNQTILLGDTAELEKKFEKLFCFYKQVWAKTGIEKYSKIDVRFDGQIVATRREAGRNNIQDTGVVVSREAPTRRASEPRQANQNRTTPANERSTPSSNSQSRPRQAGPKAVMPPKR